MVYNYNIEILRRWVKIDQDQVQFDPTTGTINYEVAFHPLKPLKLEGLFTISRLSGGIWK